MRKTLTMVYLLLVAALLFGAYTPATTTTAVTTSATGANGVFTQACPALGGKAYALNGGGTLQPADWALKRLVRES